MQPQLGGHDDAGTALQEEPGEPGPRSGTGRQPSAVGANHLQPPQVGSHVLVGTPPLAALECVGQDGGARPGPGGRRQPLRRAMPQGLGQLPEGDTRLHGDQTELLVMAEDPVQPGQPQHHGVLDGRATGTVAPVPAGADRVHTDAVAMGDPQAVPSLRRVGRAQHRLRQRSRERTASGGRPVLRRGEHVRLAEHPAPGRHRIGGQLRRGPTGGHTVRTRTSPDSVRIPAHHHPRPARSPVDPATPLLPTRAVLVLPQAGDHSDEGARPTAARLRGSARPGGNRMLRGQRAR